MIAINKVKIFVELFLQAEAEAIIARRKPNLEIYNAAYEKMHSFTVPSLKGTMGLIRRNKLKNDDYYERLKQFPPDAPRHFYKLSYYKHDEYGDLWIAYVSGRSPSSNWFTMSSAFVVIRKEDKLKIVQRFLHTSSEDTVNSYDWEPMRGYKGIQYIDNLGEFIKAVRYLKPEDEDETMDKYIEDC